jgi:dihydrofolate reductase
MKAIVAVDLNWGIGFQGQLLERIPEDMKFFKEKTLGKNIIMGRETLESLPGKKPLKDRTNIVLTTNRSYNNENIKICHSLKELFQETEKYAKEEVFVIGGESVYSQLLSYCSECYVTKIENTYEADKYFTDLDKENIWKLVWQSEEKKYNDISFKFAKYINENPKRQNRI